MDDEQKQLIEQRKQDFAMLCKQVRAFVDQNPEKHPLYEPASTRTRPNESLDYYRGLFDGLSETLQFYPVARDLIQQSIAEREKEIADSGKQIEKIDENAHEDIVIDMLRLRIGIAMAQMVKQWPQEWREQD